MRNRIVLVCFVLIFFLCGCSVIGKTLDATGKIAVATGKIAFAVGKVAVETVKTTGKVVTTIIEIPKGRRTVKLIRRGNNLLVDAVINRKTHALMVVDTGCEDTQISRGLAQRLRIDGSQGQPVNCVVAGGGVVTGRMVDLLEIRLGRAAVRNIKVVLLNQDNAAGSDGLLGMAFLSNFIFKIDAQKQVLILERRN